MNQRKPMLAVIFTLIALLGARYTPAEPMDWSKAISAAQTAQERGEYAQAQALYDQVIALQTKTLGANNPVLAISLNNLAATYQAQSMNAQAEQAYRQAV